MAGETTIRSLLVRLGVKTDDKKLAKFDQSIDKAKRNMAIAGTAAVGLAAGIAAIVVKAAQYGDAMAKNARMTSHTVTGLQEMDYVFQRSGSTLSAYIAAQRRFPKMLRDAKRGLSTSTDTLKELNLSYKDLIDLSPEDAFTRVADALKGVDNDMTRAALAQEVFGRGGMEILKIVNDQENSVASLREEARALGYIMSEETAKASEEMVDRLLDLKMMGLGVRNMFADSLIPKTNEYLTLARDWYVANRNLIEQRVDKMAERIANGIERVAKFGRKLDEVAQSFGGWKKVLTPIVTAVGVLATAQFVAPLITAAGSMASMAAAAGVASIAVGATLVGGLIVVLALIVEIALVMDDFNIALQGGDAMLTDTVQTWLSYRDALMESHGLLGASLLAMAEMNPWAAKIRDSWFSIEKYLGGSWGYIKKMVGVANKISPYLELVSPVAYLQGTTQRAARSMGEGLAGKAVSGSKGAAPELYGGKRVSVAGTTVNIYGVEGAAEARNVITREINLKQRQAAAALSGSEY